MSLVLQSSGGGQITIQEPNTASNFTQDLPAVDGTILTSASQSIPSAALPAGSVLQVVNATTTTEATNATNTYADTNLTASITPKFATSKILVLVAANGLGVRNTATYWNGYVVRDSTAIAGFCNYLSQVDQGWWGASLSYLDSPATASLTTYTLRGIRQDGSNNCVFNVTTGTAGTGTVSNITLMEIAA
jgi:hypothetical protein